VVAAVALGARVVEKHVTFDRGLDGPDHAYALTFEELATMVSDVRDVEAALGDGEKRPAPEEAAGRRLGRRSVHAARDIPAGARLEPEMLKIVRPADGAPPCDGERLVGRSATRPLRRDEPVCWVDVQ
jgi:N-acetylneuraminate synthase/N,N'-diacetyllegionaminate synthase